MTELWACIDPHGNDARILIEEGARQPILKARLNPRPSHRRALPTLLEAIALWQDKPIRAALVADGRHSSFDMSHYPDIFAGDDRTLLYSIEHVPTLHALKQQRHDRIRGMGQFHDMEQLMLLEVAR
jgi:hypothetical protein